MEVSLEISAEKAASSKGMYGLMRGFLIHDVSG